MKVLARMGEPNADDGAKPVPSSWTKQKHDGGRAHLSLTGQTKHVIPLSTYHNENETRWVKGINQEVKTEKVSK